MLENAFGTVQRFVVKHRAPIAAVATFAVCVGMSRIATKQKDEFLKEHGLYEEYYTPED